MWKVIDNKKMSAAALMSLDSKLLLEMEENDAPIIHFYDFLKPSFTFGVFLKPHELMNQDVYEKNFDFSIRPTGGGVLFHCWDFAFSCFVPKNHPGYLENVMDSYKYINDRIVFALDEYLVDVEGGFTLLPTTIAPMDECCKHFCFSKPTMYDIMFGEKKLAGAAQRRKKNGYLHQGSISLILPEYRALSSLFSNDSKVLEAMQLYNYPLLGGGATAKDRLDAREQIKQNLVFSLNKI